MNFVVRKHPLVNSWLVSSCHHPNNGQVELLWHHKKGSAHQFDSRCAAEAVAFIVNGVVEEIA